MREGVNLAIHAWIVVESITVKVTKFRYVPLHSEALKACGNIDLDKRSSFKGHEALEMLDIEYYIPIVNVFAYRHYLTFFMRPIKI